MARAQYRRTLGYGITRVSDATGAAITLRPAHDGGTRVTVSREDGGIWYPVHSRVFPLRVKRA